MLYRSQSHLAPLALLGVAFMLAGCPGDNPNAPPPPPPPAAPAPPTSLVATAMSSSRIDLSWTDASTNEDGFAIERCQGAGCSNFAAWQNAPQNATSYGDISAVAATSYSYRVRASNSAGMSAFSNTATVTTPTAGAIPAPPTNFQATAINTSRIDLSWTDAATNEDGFRIERCQGNACTNFTLQVTTLTPNGTGTIQTSLQESTTYRFRIQSFNGSGGSALVGPVSATTFAAAAPPASPSGLAAAAVSSSRIELTWTDNSLNEDGGRIERCLGAGCTTFAAIVSYSSANRTTYTDNTPAANTTYRYRVVVSNGAGPSAPSNIATATTPPVTTPPIPPTGLTATPGGSSRIDLNWTDRSSDEEGFRIERCQGAGCTNFASLTTVAANVRTYANTGLASSTTYTYRVQAYNSIGGSTFITATAATGAPGIAAPSGLTATVVSSSRIDLNWTDNSSNEDGFVLQRCTGAGCTNFASLVSIGINATTYSNTGLTSSTSYSYRIMAINSAGASTVSATATGVTPAAIAAPTLGVPSVSGSSITLTLTYTWPTLVGPQDRYEVEESTTSASAGFSFTFAYFGRPASYSHTLTGRAPGTYYYRVRAVTAEGTSPYSTVRSATVSAQATPVISVSVTSRSFNATAGGANPPSQQAAVGNAGGGTLSGLAVSENPPVSWLTVSLSATTAPATITFQATTGTLTAGTFTTMVNVTSPVAGNSPQTVQVTFTVAPAPAAPTTLRIINDLPGTVAGPNDWGLLNTVVRLRVGPTQNSVINMTAGAYELLFNGDYTSNVGETVDINPGQTLTFDVSMMTGAYYLYIQNGWWEHIYISGLWEKSMSGVVGCDGQTTVYKGAIIQITQPFGSPETIRLSDWLPIGNYYLSPFCS